MSMAAASPEPDFTQFSEAAIAALDRRGNDRDDRQRALNEAILADIGTELASFYEALRAEIKDLGLPADETALTKLLAPYADATAHPGSADGLIENMYLPAILRAASKSGVDSELLIGILSKRTGLPVAAFTPIDLIGAATAGA
jgi:hypothetical protein